MITKDKELVKRLAKETFGHHEFRSGVYPSDEIFANFENADCGCFERFGGCCCDNQETACRAALNGQPVVFNPEQRGILVSEAVYQSEGGYRAAEVEAMNDVDLAATWLQTANDYVNGQL